MKLQELFSFDIMPYVSQRIIRAGEYILHEGEKMKELIYLEKGKAKCGITHENGVISLIDFISAPSFLGDLELVGVQTNCSSIVAISDCICQVIHLQGCRDKILNDVIFLRYLCVSTGKKAVRNAEYITISQSYPLKNRLATFLLNAQNNGIYAGPHTEAAAYLGVSYRHLLYVLAQFVKDGLLEKSSGVYRICDMERLEELGVRTVQLEE